MNTRLIVAIAFALLSIGCNAETKDAVQEQKNSISSQSIAVESAFNAFSTALSNKDRSLLLTIAEPSGIHLVRSFTSGNAGGRGASFSESISPSKIDQQLTFPIQKQTSFDLPQVFTSLPVASLKALPQRALSAEIDTTSFDKWASILKKDLTNAAEVENGDPIILTSSSGKFWVYAEAQIIDNALVGGFAVFAKQNDKWKLAAVINLL